jgi:hypothetical protein
MQPKTNRGYKPQVYLSNCNYVYTEEIDNEDNYNYYTWDDLSSDEVTINADNLSDDTDSDTFYPPPSAPIPDPPSTDSNDYSLDTVDPPSGANDNFYDSEHTLPPTNIPVSPCGSSVRPQSSSLPYTPFYTSP